MKSDLNDLKKLTLDLIKNGTESEINEKNQSLIEKIYGKKDSLPEEPKALDPVSITPETPEISKVETVDKYSYAETIEEEEPLSLHEKELEMIKQALIRSKGKRKLAAHELGISERTLYRKIKQFDINDLE
jgi:transcriptional regulator with PAS, ATPase and Fis domain